MKPIFSLLIVGLSIFHSTAIACSCSPESKAQHLENATVAFIGRPVKVEVIQAAPPPKSAFRAIRESLSIFLGPPDPPTETWAPVRYFKPLNSVRITFYVSKYVKGTGENHISIMTGYGDSDCGLPVSISKTYMVYARLTDDALRTSYCFGSEEYMPPQTTQTCPGS